MTELKAPPEGRPARIAILDDYMGVARQLADWSGIDGRAEVTVFDQPFAGTEAAIRALQGFDVLSTMRERTPMPRAFFEGLPDLRAVSMTGTRNRSLDLAAAADHGVAVMATGGSGNGQFATVELAWALILAVLRDIPGQTAGMRAGAWQTVMGQALHGRTLGLLGLGRLGSRMVPVARAFGMDVVAWSPNLTDDRARAEGVDRVEKAELFARADVVSLHLVLADATRGTVGADDIAGMKPGAVLINTSRGPLIDEAALLAALSAGRIRAGLDVYDTEPLPGAHPLRQAANVVLTPHLGYTVAETFETFYSDTVENIEAWLDGNPTRLLRPD